MLAEPKLGKQSRTASALQAIDSAYKEEQAALHFLFFHDASFSQKPIETKVLQGDEILRGSRPAW
jgi:hypothetical protein